MESVLIVLTLTVLFVAVTFVFIINDGGLGKVAVSGVIALLLLLLLVFFVAPSELGNSRVPDKAEEFTRRLEPGKIYTLIARELSGDDGEQVLLIREWSGANHLYHAIRVKTASIPERFTLIDGQPVEVK